MVVVRRIEFVADGDKELLLVEEAVEDSEPLPVKLLVTLCEAEGDDVREALALIDRETDCVLDAE